MTSSVVLYKPHIQAQCAQIKVLFHHTSKNMHQHHFIQQIDFENYYCMPWKGLPFARRKSLIKKLKRKHFSNADRIFTENINAGLAYFKIKKCIEPSGKVLTVHLKYSRMSSA
jgi:hypothetical protein